MQTLEVPPAPPQQFDLAELRKQLNSDLYGVKFTVVEDHKTHSVILGIDDTPYHLTLDGAFSLSAALRKAANKISASQFKSHKKRGKK